MLTHFIKTVSDRLHVSKIALLGLVQPSREAEARNIIFQAGKPTLESKSEFDRVPLLIVIVRLQ